MACAKLNHTVPTISYAANQKVTIRTKIKVRKEGNFGTKKQDILNISVIPEFAGCAMTHPNLQ